jgi:hypothetical protein
VSDERPITLFMPLLNAGAAAYKPVQALRQREDIYCIIGPMGEGEQWKFPPGSMVRRSPKIMPDGRQEMVATPVPEGRDRRPRR